MQLFLLPKDILMKILLIKKVHYEKKKTMNETIASKICLLRSNIKSSLYMKQLLLTNYSFGHEVNH